MIANIAVDALASTAEQDDFREAVRSFLMVHSTEAAVREAMVTDTGYDLDVWTKMASQLELTRLIVPVEFGGTGATFVELAIALEEMGRALLCAPYFSTVVLATHALLLSGDTTAAADYLPGISSGALTAALAVDEGPSWNPAAMVTEATLGPAGFVLSGTKVFVVDGCSAALLLVAARTPEGVSLFAVDSGAPGLTRAPMTTLDHTRKLARITLTATPARLLGAVGTGAAIVAAVSDLAATGLAAEQAGGARRVLDMVVGYAKTRQQFGVEVGTFQAVKHACVDMLVDVESATSAARYAAWTAAYAPADLPVAASMAKSVCSQAYVRAAEANIHLHGAIGFTWEHGAQLYYKRAKSSELLFGTPREHRAQLADRIGL